MVRMRKYGVPTPALYMVEPRLLYMEYLGEDAITVK